MNENTLSNPKEIIRLQLLQDNENSNRLHMLFFNLVQSLQNIRNVICTNSSIINIQFYDYKFLLRYIHMDSIFFFKYPWRREKENLSQTELLVGDQYENRKQKNHVVGMG